MPFAWTTRATTYICMLFRRYFMPSHGQHGYICMFLEYAVKMDNKGYISMIRHGQQWLNQQILKGYFMLLTWTTTDTSACCLGNIS